MPEGPFYEEDTILDHFTNDFITRLFAWYLYIIIIMYDATAAGQVAPPC